MSIDRYSFLLAIATFAMGTDAFIVAGILPQVADALPVMIGSAGLIVSVFSLFLCSQCARRFGSHRACGAQDDPGRRSDGLCGGQRPVCNERDAPEPVGDASAGRIGGGNGDPHVLRDRFGVGGAVDGGLGYLRLGSVHPAAAARDGLQSAALELHAGAEQLGLVFRSIPGVRVRGRCDFHGISERRTSGQRGNRDRCADAPPGAAAADELPTAGSVGSFGRMKRPLPWASSSANSVRGTALLCRNPWD